MMEELRDLMASKGALPRADAVPGGGESVSAALKAAGEAPATVYQPDQFFAEAIVLMTGRPSLLVRDGHFDEPDTETWRTRLSPHKAAIEPRIPSIGRVELLSHPDFDWIGTAWLLDEDVLITNRHVAEFFAEQRDGKFHFARNLQGDTISVRIDFREEYERLETFEIAVNEILHVAPAGPLFPDIAILRVESNDHLPDPIPLAARNAAEGELVCVVGYPARDSRNAGPVMSQIFADIYDVKRFAPGYVMEQPGASYFTHDCTTLGGNSGSAVLSLESGEAIGLHFAGRFGQANYAVNIGTLKQTLDQVARFSIPVVTPPGEEQRKAEDYANRTGYREDFLGPDPCLHVPIPDLNAEVREDAVTVDRKLRGISRYVLDYTHFSVVMSRARKLARYTAVNIDGSQDAVVRRRNTSWRIDPRIDSDLQTDNALYHHNKLDRGHLVRRLDPVWGAKEEALLAEEDTFHYTNASPQHAQINQKSWLHLEDYLLFNANNRDFKLTVFTGPIFHDCDPAYRGVQIPQSFWKVAVMVSPEGRLHATAYKVGQAEHMDDLEFVLGAFETYQAPVRRIEEETGISFGSLADHDPLGQIEGIAYHRILGPEDIVM